MVFKKLHPIRNHINKGLFWASSVSMDDNVDFDERVGTNLAHTAVVWGAQHEDGTLHREEMIQRVILVEAWVLHSYILQHEETHINLQFGKG